MEYPVFAIDPGHGRIKACYPTANGTLEAFSFTAAATRHRDNTLERSTRQFSNTATIFCIRDGKTSFEVDTDPNSLPFSTLGERNEAEDFPTRPEFRALVCSALKKANARHVKLLVLGLPVALLDKYSDDLVRCFSGTLRYDDNAPPIVIERVVVLAQPLGSLIMLNERSERRVDTPSTLIIDAGWGTIDWLVTRTSGFKLDFQRSGGSPGAGAAIYRRIAEMLAARYNARFDGLDQIDLAIRTRSPLRAHGHSIDLGPYVSAAQDIALDSIRKVRARVRSVEDVSIVISGGTNFLFGEAIKEVFPGTPVQTLEEPHLANVKGFVVGALQSLRNRK
jgi:plasmid segregation protein ParM